MSEGPARVALAQGRLRPSSISRPVLAAWPWLAVLALAILIPWLFFDWSRGRHDGFVVALLTQIAMMSIFALSYNMLMGEAGLLSFGHAIFLGLPAYVTVHLMNVIGGGHLWIPEELLPAVGGLSGLLFGILFGYPVSKQRATAFAMITFGGGELIVSAAVMFQGFFGGEAE
ncbi:MAG: branched-chain amino acid ABC transporter permease [Acetobacteraceae bacterium]|nr:branched-chain amino acid ABC transporter permease [Acetobacteraceae bacterium]